MNRNKEGLTINDEVYIFQDRLAKFGIFDWKFGMKMGGTLTQIASDYWFSQLHFIAFLLCTSVGIFSSNLNAGNISANLQTFPLTFQKVTQIYDN